MGDIFELSNIQTVTMTMARTTPHIVILGAGFAALEAVRELRRRAPQARLTVVAPQAEFVYLPSLIWIPTGLRQSHQLRRDLRPFMARQGVEFLAASVTGLSEGGRCVLTDQGEVRNDALLIACGARFIRKLPGIEHALTLCAGLPAAEAIGQRLQGLSRGRIACGFSGNPEEPAAMRGGPMFELLFGIDTWLRRQGRRNQVELSFFAPGNAPGQRLGERAVGSILKQMQQRNITTHLGHKLSQITPQGVITEGARLDADLVLFMPGLSGPAWAAESGLTLSPGGFFQADNYGRVAGSQGVYVAGDAGSHPGPDWLPKQAHMAELQARATARNLLLELDGQAPQHSPRAELLCIIDSLDRGMLVYRNPQRAWHLPALRLMHWAKRRLETRYLASLDA